MASRRRSFWRILLWAGGIVLLILAGAERAASWIAGETVGDFAKSADVVARWIGDLPAIGNATVQNWLLVAALVAFAFSTWATFFYTAKSPLRLNHDIRDPLPSPPPSLISLTEESLAALSHVETQKYDWLINRTAPEADKCPLKIVFDESTDVIWKDDGRTAFFHIRVENKSEVESIDDVRVTFTIEPLSDIKKLRDKAEALRDCTLILESQDSIWREPATVHQIHPKSNLNFLFIQASRGNPSFGIRHSNVFKVAIPTQGDIWQPRPGGDLAAGKYRLIVTARGKNVPSDSRTFIFHLKGRIMTFVASQSAASVTSLSRSSLLSISFEQRWESENQTCWLIAILENIGDAALENVVASFLDMCPLSDVRKNPPDAENFRGLALRLSDNRVLSRPNPILPQTTFSIHGKRRIEFDILKWNKNSTNFQIFHSAWTSYQQQCGNPATPYVTMPQWRFPEVISLGKYRIKIEARTLDGSAAIAEFEVTATDKTFRFKEL